MPTITVDFLTTDRGFVDAGISANVAFLWASANLATFTGSATEMEKARTGSLQTWETWGVPVGAVITQIQLFSMQTSATWTPNAQIGLAFRLISFGNNICGVGQDLYNQNRTSPYSQITEGPFSTLNVNGSYKASNTPVQFEIEFAGGGFGSPSVVFGTGVPRVATLNQLQLKITYLGGTGMPTNPFRSSVSEGHLLVAESVFGTPVAGKYRLKNLVIEPDEMPDIHMLTSAGAKVNTSSNRSKEKTGGKISGTMDYNTAPFIHLFHMVPSATIAKPASVYTLTPPGSGTFTLTFNAQTTTAIAFNAIASAIGAALEALTTVELEIKYDGYFKRERIAADRMKRMGAFVLPDDAPYELFKTLSVESRQKLALRKPSTLAQAASIPGVSPADLQNLILEIEKLRGVRATAN